MTASYIGIDLHSTVIQICVLDAQGGRIAQELATVEVRRVLGRWAVRLMKSDPLVRASARRLRELNDERRSTNPAE